MPYTPQQKREWLARRRAAWFDGKSCDLCGSTDRLELDHVDPTQKVSHHIWSWAKARREAELAKCRPLCHDCHKVKSATEKARGESHGRRRLTEADVRLIRSSSLSGKALADLLNVHKMTISNVRNGHTWKHVT
jgi:5-methylcytosine-specific restriction endonuclease McrA